MKKTVTVLALVVAVFSGVGTARAAYHSFDYAAGLSPTEVVDKTKIEGWVVNVDYRQNRLRVLDPRGFERSVATKTGTISDFRRGDYVKVALDLERPWASSIEKL